MSGVRIKDIALMAGVSIGTVDRVIHDRGEVREATRKRIKALLDEHHYRPDIAGRSLALKREIKLAVIMPGVQPGHSFWRLPVRGLEQALESLSDYNIVLEKYHFDQDKPGSFRRAVKDFPFERIEGVLFAPVFRDDSLAFVRACRDAGRPVILFNSLLEGADAESYVGQNAFQSGRVAAQLFHQAVKGGETLALVNMAARKDHYVHIIDRERGFRDFFRERGEEERIHTMDLNGSSVDEIRSSLEAFFREQDIRSVFVSNSRVHLVADLERFREAGPFMVAGYDLLPSNRKALEEDRIAFLLSQKPEAQSAQGLRTLFNLVVFNQRPAARQWLPIDIITKENLEYYGTSCQ